MPKIDGYALMRKNRQLQGRSPGGQIPAIALWAYAGEVDQQPAIAAGFLPHLPKPARPAEIMNIVARFCLPHRETTARSSSINSLNRFLQAIARWRG